MGKKNKKKLKLKIKWGIIKWGKKNPTFSSLIWIGIALLYPGAENTCSLEQIVQQISCQMMGSKWGLQQVHS